jgi:hypothetical protein
MVGDQSMGVTWVASASADSTAALAAHGTAHALLLQQRLKLMAAILAATVAVKDQTRPGTAAKPRHAQRIGYRLALSLQMALSLGLDPVVQCLSGDAQYLGDRRQALSAFDHTHRFELELQRVTRP